ncbi:MULTISPECIES: tripartite tricarboxylate transporter TctB family protein [unclassified Modicisalibacter]|uniref:tripartite tricarboxylate transporter TctB family protein n=1 Tax=unclassified Modicisalibacter TaxID=2679913 RepID=UPI001CCFEECD|nr:MULTISPECIES: tripartite tricarboxylate transporter TctB family protein [unclassified Modicisalibacter]MBZ9558484.1 tripartite tricarboxylate transporter TctB family protein [Modicisalibacter sp. R2A 31.J]MBZ9575624.1 tripartite tricarboxylate transporter TctB family protein [Modicisalibacter sp. MOD 31.J]
MAQHDRLSGCLLILFGALVLWRASGFPSMAGLAYGPGLFPSIAAIGLIGCGTIIALGARRPASRGTSRGESTTGTSRRRANARMASLLGVVLGYALLLEPLGFHVASLLLVVAAARIFGLPWGRCLLLAVPLVVAVHALFYSLLHVPLPWGVLTPVAW